MMVAIRSHRVRSQKTAFFIVTAVKTSNLTYCGCVRRMSGPMESEAVRHFHSSPILLSRWNQGWYGCGVLNALKRSETILIGKNKGKRARGRTRSPQSCETSMLPHCYTAGTEMAVSLSALRAGSPSLIPPFPLIDVTPIIKLLALYGNSYGYKSGNFIIVHDWQALSANCIQHAYPVLRQVDTVRPAVRAISESKSKVHIFARFKISDKTGLASQATEVPFSCQALWGPRPLNPNHKPILRGP
jgi:hypothetical protein